MAECPGLAGAHQPFLLARGDSDCDSIRSDISETSQTFQRRRRRKQQLPWRSPYDASVITDYHRHYSQQETEPSRLGIEQLLPASSVRSAANSPTPAVHAPAASGSPVTSRKRSKQDLAGPCCHCGVTSSPQWRKGPKGKPILCNACGIRFLRTRTLGKTMPRKRRVATAAPHAGTTGPAIPFMKRVKSEVMATEDEEVELATDEVLAPEDTMLAATAEHSDGTIRMAKMHSNSHSSHMMIDTALSFHQLMLQQCGQQQGVFRPTSRLAVVSNDSYMAAAIADELDHTDHGSKQDAATLLAAAAAAQTEAAGGFSSSNTCSSYNMLGAGSTGAQEPLAAGSRHILVGASSHSFGGGNSNRARSSNNPSLAMALALHQQQQQNSSSSSLYTTTSDVQQQQPHSPGKVGLCSLHNTASPASVATAFYNHNSSDYSAVSKSPPASPLLLGTSCGGQIATSARTSVAGQNPMPAAAASALRDQQQPAWRAARLHGPSQLSMMGIPATAAGAPNGAAAAAGNATPTVVAGTTAAPGAAVPPGQPADMLQLVSHMATVLGGIGPALEFIKAISSNSACAGLAHGQ